MRIMHECRLCSRDMKTSKDTFGNGCVKKDIFIFGNEYA